LKLIYRVYFYGRLLEKGFFHRAMKYEKRSERKKKLKESLEKKETVVIDSCVHVCLCFCVLQEKWCSCVFINICWIRSTVVSQNVYIVKICTDMLV